MHVSLLHRFIQEIDAGWSEEGRRIRLRIIGSAALMFQTTFQRGTKDSDVLETEAMTEDIKRRLLSLAGPGSEIHQRNKVYIDIVSRGLPFLPQSPLCHLLPDLNSTMRHLEVEVLDVVDVIVSKLKRFNANDVSDIRAMADMGKISHPRLIDRFQSAVDRYSMDARADELEKYVRNLNRVERDFLLVAESEIALPSWIA